MKSGLFLTIWCELIDEIWSSHIKTEFFHFFSRLVSQLVLRLFRLLISACYLPTKWTNREPTGNQPGTNREPTGNQPSKCLTPWGTATLSLCLTVALLFSMSFSGIHVLVLDHLGFFRSELTKLLPCQPCLWWVRTILLKAPPAGMHGLPKPEVQSQSTKFTRWFKEVLCIMQKRSDAHPRLTVGWRPRGHQLRVKVRRWSSRHRYEELRIC